MKHFRSLFLAFYLTVLLSANANGAVAGGAYTFGYNNLCQLGDGTKVERHTPVRVGDLFSNVFSLSAGSGHNLAVKTDGTAWAWGNNQWGQLGNGGNGTYSAPTRVYGLTNVALVSAGSSHSLAVKSDGTVWAWGNNDFGALGDGTNTDSAYRVQVKYLTSVKFVSAGYSFNLAVKTGGSVFAWGYNEQGQLGDGTTYNSSTPKPVSSLSNVKSVSAGALHSLAVKNDGTVWAWGDNAYGQLGDGTVVDRRTPVQVSGLTNVVSVCAGAAHSLAVKSDGSVWAWGRNNYGQLGDGTTSQRKKPVMVSGLTNVATVSAGGFHDIGCHSLAVKTDGTVWAWGRNDHGQLGDGSTVNRNRPVQVASMTDVALVEAGEDHSMVLKIGFVLSDVAHVLAISAGFTTPTTQQVQRLDVTHNGLISIDDGALIAMKVNGWANNP